MTALDPRVTAALAALPHDATVLPCDPELADTAAFCAHYGYPLAQSANALLVRTKRGEPRFGVCIVLATHGVVNRTLRKLLGSSKVSFASAGDTIERTGMQIGGVTPFGLPEDLPIYVDAAVLDCPWVIVGAGSRSAKLKVDPQALLALPSAEAVQGLATPRQER